MVERTSAWPKAILDNVNPDWWSEVMLATGIIPSLLDDKLTDEEEFSIRSITYVIFKDDPNKVKAFFKESVHSGEFTRISDLIHSGTKETRKSGIESLLCLIDRYKTDILNSR